jgi:hypothetical protein
MLKNARAIATSEKEMQRKERLARHDRNKHRYRSPVVCETASENNQIAFQAFLAKPSLSGLPLLLLLTIPPLKPLR